MRIEICGGIASGRSSLAQKINLDNYKAVFEDFTNHPFLVKFYEDVNYYALETELMFLLQHFHQIKKERGKNIICDYSFLLDLAFADVTLNYKDLIVFENLRNEILQRVRSSNLIVHLKCSPETMLTRIYKRGREMEKNITLDYLRKLNKAIENRIIKENETKIIEIDAEKYNFVENMKDRKYIQDMIIKATI